MAIAPVAQCRARLGRRGQDHLLAGALDLNPYLSGGTKDIESASLIVEPLARFDQNGSIGALARDEIPTVENGGVSADLTSITWKLAEGLMWSDGTPLTSADVKFTWQYCTHADGGCAQASAKFDGVASIEAGRPDHRGELRRSEAVPYTAFVGARAGHPEGPVRRLPRRQGARMHRGQLRPGRHRPFVVTDFRPTT
jgi:peptide/nickel transport system substrate-binding protein